MRIVSTETITDAYVRTKQRLEDLRKLNIEIDNEISRLEFLQDRISSVSSPQLTGMPHASGNVDKIGILIGNKDELERRIKDKICKRDDESHSVDSMIELIPDPNERAVLRMRYIDCDEWEEIAYVLFPNSKCEYESVQRKVFRIHRNAISSLSMIS